VVAFRFAGKVLKYAAWVPAKIPSKMPPSCSSMDSDWVLVDSVLPSSTGNTPTLRASFALAFSLSARFFLASRELNWKAKTFSIVDGLAGTCCRIQKSEIVASLGCTATSDRVNSRSLGEEYISLDHMLPIRSSDWTKR
jgi:hypothetical protein